MKGSRFPVLSLAGIAAIVLTACTTVKPEIQQPNPRFTWEPPAKDPDQKINLALVSPVFGTDAKLGSFAGNKYLSLFLDALQTDFEKALIAKGFTVTGPYHALDEMTYPDKKAAPLALFPEVAIVLDESYTVNQTQPTVDVIFTGKVTGKWVRRAGTVTVSAFVKCGMIEPLSGQKIWLKKIDVAPETASIDVDLLMDNYGRLNSVHHNRDNSSAAVVDALNRAYPAIMQKFWSYLNTEEIQAMKKSVDEIRARKVF